jgi:dethiobiotin synthetase
MANSSIIPGVFITGTNTGVGKTAVAAAILRVLAGQGVLAVGLKPIASGSERRGPGEPLRNSDALELQAAAPVQLAYETVNPWCFEPAIAPHLAAQEAGQGIALPALIEWYRRATERAQFAVVEGAGGWRVPLHPDGFLSDLPEALGLDVILVVGCTLGCLNHARLTAEAIQASGRSRLVGWIANEIDPGFERKAGNLATLERLLGSPPLAVAPWTDLRSPGGNPVLDLGGAVRLRQALFAALSC